MPIARSSIANSIAQSLLKEFETQVLIARRFFERLPNDKLTWKPHEKSMTTGQFAYHLATVPGSVVRTAGINPAPAPDFANFPQLRVYLRILNVPVPTTWRPSADEPPRPMQGWVAER